MTEDGPSPVQPSPAPVASVRAHGLAWYKVDDLSAAQVAAMQTLDDACREGVLTGQDARIIERMIRDGRVHGARKRVTQARKR